MCSLQFCSGLGFQVWIDRIVRDFIGFVDRRRLGLLLCSIVARLQICRFQLVHAIQHAIKFGLKAQIGANFGGALQQQVDGTVKMLFGCVPLTGGVPV